MKQGLLTICGLLLLGLWALFTPACTNDELPMPTVSAVCDTLIATYDTNVKPIIEESCAYSACHSANTVTGAPGDFTSYSGMLLYLENNSFRNRVLGTDDSSPLIMPPNNLDLYPQTEKDNLTDEEQQIIECWLNAGFPEN